METQDNNSSKKRGREESEDSETEVYTGPNLKLARVGLANTVSDCSEAAHEEYDPDGGDFQSPEAKRIPEVLLNILDESEQVIGPDEAIQGLDLVMKSFEEEILVPVQEPVPVITSDSGESRPELGFLFEASDDELGLPPIFSIVEEEQKFGTDDVNEGGRSGAVEIGEMIGHEFQIPSYESLQFGISGDSDTNDNHTNSGDFVAFEGLFEPAVDISELTRRPETLSAL